MKRGELVTVALPGDYGKPRPALTIQSDLFSEHPSITLLPVTSELRDARLCFVCGFHPTGYSPDAPGALCWRHLSRQSASQLIETRNPD